MKIVINPLNPGIVMATYDDTINTNGLHPGFDVFSVPNNTIIEDDDVTGAQVLAPTQPPGWDTESGFTPDGSGGFTPPAESMTLPSAPAADANAIEAAYQAAGIPTSNLSANADLLVLLQPLIDAVAAGGGGGGGGDDWVAMTGALEVNIPGNSTTQLMGWVNTQIRRDLRVPFDGDVMAISMTTSQTRGAGSAELVLMINGTDVHRTQQLTSGDGFVEILPTPVSFVQGDGLLFRLETIGWSPTSAECVAVPWVRKTS